MSLVEENELVKMSSDCERHILRCGEISNELEDEANSKQEETEEILSQIGDLINSSRTVENYAHNQTVAFRYRSHTLEWLHIINQTLKGSPVTFLRSVFIYELFLEKEKTFVLDKDNIALHSAVCYYISFKSEDSYFFNMEFLHKQLLKEKFSKESIIKTELNILKKINFKLQLPTLNNYSELYMELIKKTLHCDYELLSSEAIAILEKVNNFVNVMSQFVNELIFDPLYKLSIVNLKTALLFLEKEDKLTFSEIEKINGLITYMLNFMCVSEKEINEIEETSEELFKAIENNMINCKKKTFLNFYREIM